MKKIILVLSAVASLVVAGCNQSETNQGGTSDQYNTNAGAAHSHNYTTNSTTRP